MLGALAPVIAGTLLIGATPARQAAPRVAGDLEDHVEHRWPRESGAIAGEVMDRRGTPLDAAHVDVRDGVTGETVSVLSDANGNFIVHGLAGAHTYAVAVRRIGYVPRTVHDVPVRAGRETAADVTMDAISIGRPHTMIAAKRGSERGS